MDNFEPQGSGIHLRVGHEEGDFSLRGIILFIVILVLSAVLTFFAAWGLMNLFEWWAKNHEPKSTPAQQQLSEQRGETPTKKEGVKPQHDWYNRAVDEKVLQKTFAAPRLQYDDEGDMGTYLKAEKERLDSTGKDPDGNIHIPINRAIDLLSKQGLPPVNGTFTPQPALGELEAVANAAQRRLGEANAPAQQPNNRKK